MLRRESVCVLVRDRRGVSAAQRVDQLLSTWEQRLGVILPRPVVFDADLTVPGMRLSPSDTKWICNNVKTVVHCAASVLIEDTPFGEPMKTNLDGTRNLLDLIRDSVVEDFHFISSAYSYGRVPAGHRVVEELHPDDGPRGNVYQTSKMLAEHLVTSAAGGFTRTIYRPSTIIGESSSGYAPSFNAIYTPLRLGWLVFRNQAQLTPDIYQQLGARKKEARNLVPVDWVARAVSSLVRSPACHQRIYHLTNPTSTDGKDIILAMIETVLESRSLDVSEDSFADSERLDDADFGRRIEAFSSHFQADPEFDNSNFLRTGVCPPCPKVDQASLKRTFEHAIRVRFENHETQTEINRNSDLNQILVKLTRELSANRDGKSPKLNGNGNRYHTALPYRLTISGSGGGCWQIISESGSIRIGLPDGTADESPHLYATSRSIQDWLANRISFAEAQRSGKFLLMAKTSEVERSQEVFEELRELIRGSMNLSQFHSQNGTTHDETLTTIK